MNGNMNEDFPHSQQKENMTGQIPNIEIESSKQNFNNSKPSRLDIELPDPIFEEKAKTFNNPFGNVNDFLNFIMKRTPESLQIFQMLGQLDLNASYIEYEEIVDLVEESIVKSAEKASEKGLLHFGFSEDDIKDQAAKFTILLRSEKLSLKDFLRLMVKIYTKESYVCYWLNDLLRSKKWDILNIFGPYFVCLTYSFKLGNSQLIEKESKLEKLAKFFKGYKINLYRGSAMPLEDILKYRPEETKEFSWNSITSTTFDDQVAVKFRDRSVKKAKKAGLEKFGIIFKISYDVSEEGGYLNIMKISKYPHEKEIILAPATIYYIKRFEKVGENYEVKLEVTKKIVKNSKYLGELQKKIFDVDSANFNALDNEDLFHGLELLSGNELVNKINITKCNFDAKMIEALNTTISRLQNQKSFSFTQNKITSARFRDFYPAFEYFSSLERLYLDLRGFNYEDNESLVFDTISQKLKNLMTLVVTLGNNVQSEKNILRILPRLEMLNELKISISYCNNFDKDLSTKIFELISEAKHIKYLKIITEKSSMIDDKVLRDIYKAVCNLTRLENLSLKFQGSSEKNILISNEGINEFSAALFNYPKSLVSLSLEFMKSPYIFDFSLRNLLQNVSGMSNLKGFMLRISSNEYVSEELFSDILFENSSLTNLTLHFISCKKVDDIMLIKLWTLLDNIKNLESLDLNFDSNVSISDKSIERLSNCILKLEKLTKLNLSFDKCLLSDRSLTHISQMWKNESLIKSLDLSFNECNQISDWGIIDVAYGLRKLNNLNSLSLNFKKIKQIEEEGVKSLVKSITESKIQKFEKLVLDFSGCEMLTHLGKLMIEDTIKFKLKKITKAK